MKTLGSAIALSALSHVLACGDDTSSSSEGTGASSTGGAGGSGADATTGGGGQGTGATSAGGSGGAGNGATGGDGGSGGAVGSEGCGQAAADVTETWVAKTVDVGGTTREWFVWLPSGYDPQTPYPVVYQFHGCSGNVEKQNNNPPVQNESGPLAIHVRGRAVDNCWDSTANGTDVAFFDALVSEVEATWCADVDRRFATGYSSGAFMTHRLACDRGDVLRGVASIAGGTAGNGCAGKVAALLIHDDTDPQVNISASESARDRHLTNNGCDAGAPTTPGNYAPCEVYAGCDAGYPVVWCETTGQGHSRQDALSAPAFWDFLGSL